MPLSSRIKLWIPIFILLISWNGEVDKLYETISAEKQGGRCSVDLIQALTLEESVPHMIKKLTGALDVQQIKENNGVEVYRTEKHIIKVYNDECYKEFINEIWSIETLRRCEPQSFVVPTIEGVYSLFDVVDTYYLLVEKCFSGKTLFRTRNEKAFNRYGAAFAELHQLNGIKCSNRGGKFSKYSKKHIGSSWKLKQRMKCTKSCGYIQFDAHEGNVLYDEQRDLICLIDLSAIGYFVDEKLQPTAPTIFDYMYVIHKLEDEPCLQDAFIQGYSKGGGEQFSSRVLRNYRKLVPFFHIQTYTLPDWLNELLGI